MSRIVIFEDGQKTGRWFDDDKAELFNEETYWDGSNWISKATGSQFKHEAIYVTAGGVFIKNSWSQFQGGDNVCEIISESEAAEWFVMNEYPDDDIPAIFQKSVSELEVK